MICGGAELPTFVQRPATPHDNHNHTHISQCSAVSPRTNQCDVVVDVDVDVVVVVVVVGRWTKVGSCGPPH